jgi:hypothetical protein
MVPAGVDRARAGRWPSGGARAAAAAARCPAAGSAAPARPGFRVNFVLTADDGRGGGGCSPCWWGRVVRRRSGWCSPGLGPGTGQWSGPVSTAQGPGPRVLHGSRTVQVLAPHAAGGTVGPRPGSQPPSRCWTSALGFIVLTVKGRGRQFTCRCGSTTGISFKSKKSLFEYRVFQTYFKLFKF